MATTRMQSNNHAHHEILKALLRLYESNDKETLDCAMRIAWELGVNLNVDSGYHELAELIQNKIADNSEGNEHYMSIIETQLRKLQS